MKDPVDHIQRPKLPWRNDDDAITECGYDSSKVKTITRDTYFQRVKEMGSRRCALFTCMTCSQTASRWGTWEDDPRRALDREIDWEAAQLQKRGDRLRDELLAIAHLIGEHREEFDEFIRVLIERRAWVERKRKAEVDAKNKPKTLGLL